MSAQELKGTHDPLEHRIRLRAYDLWIEEGKPFGRHLEHWAQAQHEIQGREWLEHGPADLSAVSS